LVEKDRDLTSPSLEPGTEGPPLTSTTLPPSTAITSLPVNSSAVVPLVVADAAALRKLFDEHLSKGRAFVLGASGVTERQACDLVVEFEGRAHRLAAEVVFVRAEDPGRGVGLALAKLDANGQAALRAFVEGPAAEAPTAEESSGACESETETAAEGEPAPEATEGEAEGEAAVGEARIESLHDRVRSLTGAEQLKLAAAGTLAERTTLERLYGPTVWETLLRNPRITPPEVARIARKGSLPRPLIELVASNSPWLASGEVQRALLSNPRSSSTVVLKVLSAMSRHDLMLVPQQTAYPETVRQAAKKRLGR